MATRDGADLVLREADLVTTMFRRNQIKWHYRGPDGFCRVDGGSISPSRCPKCLQAHDVHFERLIRRADKLAGGR